MNQKHLLAIAITLCAGIFVGFLLGKGSGAPNQSIQIQKLQSQIEQAKRFFPPTPQDIRSVSGIIKEVKGNIVVLEASLSNPFDESPRMRNILIGSETKITRNEQKDPTEYQREIAEFQKAIQSQKPGVPPSVALPTPFREIPAVFSDIRTEQQVSVTAAENIRDKESFTATQVSITGVNIPVTIPL